MKFSPFGCLLALALASPAGLPAQSSARDAAVRFLEAWDDRRWSEAARLLDLDQFDRFRREFVTRARRLDQGPRPTVEELRRRDPSMPREVAEYQVRMMEEQRRRYADPTPYEFARVTSISALERLGAAEAAARWLESRDPRWQVQMQFEQAGCPVPSDLDQMPPTRRTLVGVIPDGERRSYALVRQELPDGADADATAMAGGDLTVMELTLVGSRWLVRPRADLVPEVGEVDLSECRR